MCMVPDANVIEKIIFVNSWLAVTSKMFLYLGIHHVGVPPWVKFKYVYMPSLCNYSKLQWISSEKERVPSIDELCSKIPILSVLQKTRQPH